MSEVITWIDPSGVSTILTGQTDREVLRGRTGAFMPPVEHLEDDVPEQPGARLREVRVRPREIDLPLLIKADTSIAVRQKVRTLLRTFDPSRGTGKLRFVTDDGEQREVYCRYLDGMQGVEGGDVHAGIWIQFLATFRAVDPYLYATSPVVDTYLLGTPATFFPILPVRVSSSTIFADIAVTNGGDVDAWPVWTITGPGSALVLRNLTTGKLLSLSTVLGAGETIEIDTRPDHKTIRKGDGTNLFGDRSNDSALWLLAPEANSVRIELNSATAASSVALSYTPRYLGG